MKFWIWSGCMTFLISTIKHDWSHYIIYTLYYHLPLTLSFIHDYITKIVIVCWRISWNISYHIWIIFLNDLRFLQAISFLILKSICVKSYLNLEANYNGLFLIYFYFQNLYQSIINAICYCISLTGVFLDSKGIVKELSSSIALSL